MKPFMVKIDIQQLIVVVIICSLCFACSDKKDEDFTLPDTVDFNYHIRPILSQNCYLCHGPDPSSREADLRLDIYEGATAKSDDGQAIYPHNAAKSLLVKRISSDDPDYQMPPPEAKKTLSKKEIALIEKWIDQGAEWKEHWAFIKPTIADNPSIDTNTIHENIDYYINRQLDLQQLEPIGSAEDHQLIRRVAYLTTGLPPSTEELSRFTNFNNETYEKMIDYYLNSPHYGERWARHWMDLVRYAEHRGHEFDFSINGAYHYRDYLIRAFNKDVPYDQIVKEHLAGDLLEEPRVHPQEGYNESVIATAYVNLGEGKHSPVSIKEEEASRIDNMIDVTSKTFQALTVSCARCHDHKFDPIPTSDYYAMYGMFESSRIGPTSLLNDKMAINAAQQILETKQNTKESLANQLLHPSSELTVLESKGIHDFINSESANSISDIKIIGDFTQSNWNDWVTNGHAFGGQPTNNNIGFDSDGKNIEIIKPSASSRSLFTGVLGTLRSPNFIIEHDTIGVYAKGEKSMVRIIVDNFQLIQNPLHGSLSKNISHNEYGLYKMDVSYLKGHKAYIEILPGEYSRHEYSLDSTAYIDVQYVIAYSGSANSNKLKNETAKNHKTVSVEKQKAALQNWKTDVATNNDIDIINAMLRKKGTSDNPNTVKSLRKAIDNNYIALSDAPMIHTMSDGGAVMSPVFIRGDYKQLDNKTIPHGFLTAPQLDIPSYDQEGSGRMEWAAAVLHPDNPLTSRVMVNRIWHHIFGRGIVETVDNFGLQGKLPSHPDLLDYLAVRFKEEGWSIKSLIKEILLGKTFRKSTIPTEENIAVDPENTFLHHFPIRRLEGEAIRDAMLACSDEIDTTMFGAPVPIHLTDFMTGRGKPNLSGPLDGEGRRSIYTSVRRNFLPPMMLTFDMPIPFSTFGKRNTTNVPAQALALMNDPFVYQQAEKWATRIVKDESQSVDDRIDTIYLTAFARKPSAAELQEAKELLEALGGNHSSDQETGNDLELWTHFCHSIYNLKEFIHLM